MKTVEQVVTKWAQRAGNAGQAWLDGVNSVTTAPGQLAAAQGDRWFAKMSSQETFAKWKQNVAAVTNEVWKAITTSKGAGRYTSGITASMDKARKVFSQILNYENAGLATIRAMPHVTLEDSKQRAVAWIDYMSKFKKAV
jgi:hypothetical protein